MRTSQILQGFFYSSIVFSASCAHKADTAGTSSSTLFGTDTDNITPKNMRDGGATPKSVPVIEANRICEPGATEARNGQDCDPRTQGRVNDDAAVTTGR